MSGLKRNIMPILIVIALLLAGLQPLLRLLDNLSESNRYVSQVSYWYITLFAIDGSMMLLGLIPGLALYVSNKTFYMDAQHSSVVGPMSLDEYQVWIKSQLKHSWLVMSGFMMGFLTLVFLLPLLKQDSFDALGMTSNMDVITVIWFTLSSLLAGLALVNVMMLLCRSKLSFILNILALLTGFFFIRGVLFLIQNILFGVMNDNLLEWLMGFDVNFAMSFGAESYLILPTSIFVNLLLFLSSYIVVIYRLNSKEKHMLIIRNKA